MAFTHSFLASSTVGSGGASTITFNNIPQNYTDLILKFSIRTGRTGATEDALRIVFNGVGGTAYTTRILYGSGTGIASTVYSSQAYSVNFSVNDNSSTSSVFGNGELYLPNYTVSSNKSFFLDAVMENNGTAATHGLNTGLLLNTTAVSQITLTANSGSNFLQYSTAYLYGIRAGEY
jgi:hypothetical protein